jgi:hypothetical protein
VNTTKLARSLSNRLDLLACLVIILAGLLISADGYMFKAPEALEAGLAVLAVSIFYIVIRNRSLKLIEASVPFNPSLILVLNIIFFSGISVSLVLAHVFLYRPPEIAPFTWEIFRFFVEGGGLQSEVIGTFTQYPLMLAWAVTIHKGQGKTFDRVIIDVGRGTFAHGQMYVALSRCTTLGGIVLKRPALKKHIWTNYQVMDFLTKYQYKKAEQSYPVNSKIEVIRKAIENEASLEIVYLKPNDEKTTRVVRPEAVGEMEYHGKKYLGMRAFCLKRREERVFRVDRILEIREA